MTHDDSEDHKQASDIDNHLIAKLPFGIHFDSLEAKWILIGVSTGALLVLSGSTELLSAIGAIALGARTAEPKRFPKLAAMEAQPWYWLGGLMASLPLWMAVRWQLSRLGVATPNVDWATILELITTAL